MLTEDDNEYNPEITDVDKIRELIEKLEPLLRKGDFEALGYVEKLKSIAGMDDLTERIDDYDFTGALELIEAL